MTAVMPLVEELSPAPDPVRCCEQLAGLPYRLFLDSARTATPLRPLLVPHRRSGRRRPQPRREAECLDLRTGARRGSAAIRSPHTRAGRAARGRTGAGLPPFQGGAAGYLAYDWGLHARAAARRRATTTSRCPTSCSASTTGCSRGTTTRRARG